MFTAILHSAKIHSDVAQYDFTQWIKQVCEEVSQILTSSTGDIKHREFLAQCHPSTLKGIIENDNEFFKLVTCHQVHEILEYKADCNDPRDELPNYRN